MKIRFITLITVLMILTFALPLSAQKKTVRNLPTLFEDTAMFPHDFNDKYYLTNGVDASLIIGRRTGNDFLSVFGASSNPIHNNVRVLITLPAYDQNGEIRFWTPLGDLSEKGFTDTAEGVEAREIAARNPIYAFPKVADPQLKSFSNIRQAALIDLTQDGIFYKGNPLGLRAVFLVNFTEKAFTTKEGIAMMNSLGKKNGLSVEGTPLIKNTDEINFLQKSEFISVEIRPFWEDPTTIGSYTLAPVIRTDKNEQLIARDAFLIMAMKDWEPLPDERIFADMFEYLQKFSTPPYDSIK